MNNPPHVLLFGAGSVGAVYLYQFQQAGCKVTAVCRSNYDAVKQNGFTLLSQRFGNVHFKPDTVVRSAQECPKDIAYDFVFVATKSFPGSTPSLADQIRPVMGNHPRTAIALAQNGIAIEDELAEEYPDNPLLSCVVYLPAIQTRQGVIEYPEMLNLLEIGTFPSNAPEPHQAAAKQLASLVVAGGGQADVHYDIQIARWGKLLMNCSWSPVCALSLSTDADFVLLSAPYSYDLVWGVVREIIELAKTIGIPNITEQVAEQKMGIAKRRAEARQGRVVSMLQDVKQGRLFEVEAIVGNTIRLGQRHGVKMPLTNMLYALAKARFDVMVREQSARQAAL